MATTQQHQPTMLVIITGASRGFGYEVAVAMHDALGESHAMTFVLLSRSQPGLDQCRERLASAAAVHTSVLDLSARDISYDPLLPAAPGVVPGSLEQHEIDASRLVAWGSVLLVNNVGSLGALGPLTTWREDDLVTAMQLNVVGPSLLASTVLRMYRSAPRINIVNVSSLCAVAAFPGWGMYCSVKAARDMLHKVIDKEAKAEKREGQVIKTLNYAPGILDTAMQEAARSSQTDYAANTSFYREIHASYDPDAAMNKDAPMMLSAARSAALLARIISTDSFVSGSHVDFFDHPLAE